MSKYTTETRYICETYSGVTSGSINETIDKSIPYIFNDDWNTYNPNHKEELCRKILKHYYMYEIGFETVGLWKLQLNELLNEIMPKYNVLYANLESIKMNLLNNVNTTESRELTGMQNTMADSKNSDNTVNNSDSSSTSDTSSSGNSNGNTDGWQETNDTPQGGLDGIESRKYLTNAVHNRSTNNNEQNQKAEASAHTVNNAAQTSDSEGHSIGKSDTSEKYTLTINGKNSGTSYIDEYMKVQEKYNDIDLLIINELKPCFMLLWE